MWYCNYRYTLVKVIPKWYFMMFLSASTRYSGVGEVWTVI